MEFIAAKNMLVKTKNPMQWFGIDYNMNVYRGCCHGCIYCDSRSECYKVDNFDIVRAKENALEILERELKGKRRVGIIGTGAMSDPYNPFEADQNLTGRALEIINRHGFGLAIATKSNLITRDVDILRRIREHSPVIVKITVTSSSDELCSKIEPNVARSSSRFSAVKQLSDEGIFTGILLMPVLPFIEDNEDNIIEIVEQAAKNGAKFIYPAFAVSLRQNQRDYFLKQIDNSFPGLKERYIKAYGNSYWCPSPKSKELWKIFKENCEKYRLLYRMQDIITAYKQLNKNRQLSLF